MLAELDTASGAVRVDDEGLAALLGAMETADAVGPLATALASPAVAEALDALRRPLVTLELAVASPHARVAHRLSLVPGTAALLLGVTLDIHQLMALPPAFVPSSLVRLTRMRPRRVDERSDVAFSAARFGELVDPDPDRRSRALADAGADLAWRLDVRWADGGQLLTATDGPSGLRLAEADRDLLRAVTNTEVYRIFATALPVAADAAS